MESVGVAVRCSLLGSCWSALNAKGKERWKVKNWIKVDENNRPNLLVPYIVWGVLEGERKHDSHEGYCIGDGVWLSVRPDPCKGKDNLALLSVTHFRPMPGSPEEEVAALHNRLAGRCRWVRHQNPDGMPYLSNPHVHGLCVDKPNYCPDCGKQVEEIKG